jgi:hypothetical protein
VYDGCDNVTVLSEAPDREGSEFVIMSGASIGLRVDHGNAVTARSTPLFRRLDERTALIYKGSPPTIIVRNDRWLVWVLLRVERIYLRREVSYELLPPGSEDRLGDEEELASERFGTVETGRLVD